MAIRHVAPHPHKPGMQVGGPLLLIGVLLIAMSVVVAVALQSRWAFQQAQQSIPAAPAVVDQVHDTWYLEVSPAAPAAPIRDSWWAEQPAASSAPVTDSWWAQRPARLSTPVRDSWWAEQPTQVAPPIRDSWWAER